MSRAKDSATRAALRVALQSASTTPPAAPATPPAAAARAVFEDSGAAAAEGDASRQEDTKDAATEQPEAAAAAEPPPPTWCLQDARQSAPSPCADAMPDVDEPPAPPPAADAHAAPAEAPRAAAAASRRARVRALCIGIDAYAEPAPGRLTSAADDARAVHAALSALPGAASSLLTDCSKAELQQALRDFRDSTGACAGRGLRSERPDALSAAAAAPAERTLALVYFAGHGLQVSGSNFLVPSDFAPPQPAAAAGAALAPLLRATADACVSLDAVEEMLEEAGVSAAAVWLDCCRAMPDFLAGAGAACASGARVLPAGMAMGDAVPTLPDVTLLFAAAPGALALERSAAQPARSPLAAALLQALAAPLRLLNLSPFLVDAVAADTCGQQRPHVGGAYGVHAGKLKLG
jgi:hypothetical protein